MWQLAFSHLVNSTLYNYCLEVIAAFCDRNDEIVAHRHTNAERQSILSVSDEAEHPPKAHSDEGES